MSSAADLAALLDEYPQNFAEHAGIALTSTPSPLLRLLTSLLTANLDPTRWRRAVALIVM